MMPGGASRDEQEGPVQAASSSHEAEAVADRGREEHDI